MDPGPLSYVPPGAAGAPANYSCTSDCKGCSQSLYQREPQRLRIPEGYTEASLIRFTHVACSSIDIGVRDIKRGSSSEKNHIVENSKEAMAETSLRCILAPLPLARGFQRAPACGTGRGPGAGTF